MINADLLRMTSIVLADVLSNTGPADVKLGLFFKQHRNLGTKDRAFVAESVYGVLRRKAFLMHVAEGNDPRKLLLAYLIRVLGMSTRELSESLNAQQTEWMHAIKAKKTDDMTQAEKADLPEWFWEKLVLQYGEEEALTIARSMHQQASLDLRVNIVKATREDVIARFGADKTEVSPTPYAPYGLRMPQK